MEAWGNQVKFLSFIFHTRERGLKLGGVLVTACGHESLEILCMEGDKMLTLSITLVAAMATPYVRYRFWVSAPWQVLSLELYLLSLQFSWLPRPARYRNFSLLHLPDFQEPHPNPLILFFLPLIADFGIQFLCSVSPLGYDAWLGYTHIPLPLLCVLQRKITLLSFKEFLEFHSRYWF